MQVRLISYDYCSMLFDLSVCSLYIDHFAVLLSCRLLAAVRQESHTHGVKLVVHLCEEQVRDPRLVG